MPWVLWNMKFTIPLEPVPKLRHRTTRSGRPYTPPKTLEFEMNVKLLAQAAGVRPLSGPVSMSIDFYFSVPKSRERKRKPVKGGWHTMTPDLDNLAKSVADALNGVAYGDDCQVSVMHLQKFELPQGERGRIDVTVVSL